MTLALAALAALVIFSLALLWLVTRPDDDPEGEPEPRALPAPTEEPPFFAELQYGHKITNFREPLVGMCV